MEASNLLHKIERAYVKGVKASPGGIPSGPFLVHLNPDSNLPWLNNAVLDDESLPFDATAVLDMMVVFFERERTPRMELFKELRPDLISLLEAAGFTTESETPVMVCDKAALRPYSNPKVGVEWVTPDSDPVPFMRAVDSAFGGTDDISPERIERFRQNVRRGAHWAAQGVLNGQVVGGASLVPSEGTAELAGVGTRPDHRRKGVALAVSSFLMAEFFKSGDLVWLSAGDAAAQAVYEKLGFELIGTQVNISYSPKAAAQP